MRSSIASALLLLTAACNRNLYVGHDESSEVAGAAALISMDVVEPANDAGLAQPLDAGAAPVMSQVTAPTSRLLPPPVMVTTRAPDCTAPMADCDGSADNACETDLSKDRQHCGACDQACGTTDCMCENGKLTLHCPSGRADCDGDISNGCEADLQTSTENCGTCKHVCHTRGHDVVTASCVAGQCEMTCEPRVSPETDCDHNPDNGCETYLWFDANNCGQCGNRCFTMCEAGVCML